MSDEPTPPPLRLKPRVRPETPPATPVASSAESPAAGDAPRLRLKPKLSADIAPAPAAPAAPPVAPAIEPAPEAKTVPPVADLPQPPASVPAISVETDRPVETPKFRLKSSAPESALPAPPPPMPLVAEPPVAPAKAGAPAPFSVIAEATRGPKAFPPPVPPSPASLGESIPSPVAKRRPPVIGRGTILALVAVLAVSGGIVGYLYFTMPAAEPPPPPKPVLAAPAKAPASTPAAKPTTALGQAVDKARATVATNARRIDEQNEIVGGESPAPAAAGSAPTRMPVAAEPVKPALVTTQIAPGVTASSASMDITGNASAAFRAWVGNARISGVFQGTPARALVNGRAFRAGQSVDDSLGIVLDAIDTTAKTIRFRDRSGATALRRY